MKKMQLSQLIKSNGKYDLTIFSNESIDRIESNIFEKFDFIKDKFIQLGD